ncbi:MAG: phosphoribosylformimino-5-aminoimidazole carboxamide ribotide isomerase [Lachnospiraceae bacterium]|nr:phosphoribosylformimino-5-aminoimidazole carboxamide ribotide isomerase [Lachnospiraceae bacterium]
MKFRPCIDIHNGKVKQIVGSSLKDNSDPTENFVSGNGADFYAKLYKENGLPGGHIIILNKFGTPEYEDSKNEAMKAFKEYPNGLQIGGGITDTNASDFIKMGASHVIVTSYLFENGKLSFERMKRLNDSVSKKNIVFDLSCKKVQDKYFIATDRWQTITDTCMNSDLLNELSGYCDEYLIHAVDVEGKQNGPELDIIKELSLYKGNAITYAGGIRSYQDIEAVRDASNGRIDYTIGSALDIFGGNLKFSKVANEYTDR